MSTVALTDTVTITYKATLESGEVIDATPKNRPLTLSIGDGKIFPAVEVSLLGMEPGQTRTVTIAPEDAYGPYYKELVHTLPRSLFEGKIEPKPGMILSLALEKDGREEQVPATVLSANNDTVTVDYNHPLAGKPIIYTINLVGINK
ncbi:FKBP-type peptidyl-prolyl cis-trans isomerase [Desulfolithobacter sp.]